jgi:vitamin B12 transporter
MSLARLKYAAALLPLSLSCIASVHAQQELDPVVVTATRQATRESDLLADVTVISHKEIEKHAGDSIIDLLAEQPGIQMNRNGGAGQSSSLYIRGANSNQTKILVDGVPINSLDASGSALRYLTLDNIDHIEILRGPASTLYGADAIGGVIQIFTRQPEPGLHFDSFLGYGTQNTLRANAGLSVGQEKWRARVEANRMSTDGIPAETGGLNQDAKPDGYTNTGGSVAFTLLPAAGHELGVSFRQNQGRAHYSSGYTAATDSSYSTDSAFDYYTDFTTSQARLYSKDQLTSFWKSTLQYGQSLDWQKFYSVWSPQGQFLQTINKQLSWQNDVDLPLGKMLIALEHDGQKASSDASQPLTAGSYISNNSALLGWTANWGKNRWQINGRHDANSIYGDKNTYSASYGYQLTPQWRAQASYGTAFKAPTLYQLYIPFYGNANLQPELSHNREVSLVWEREEQTASLTYYRNNVSNLINYVPTDSFGDGQYQNVGQATLQGATLSYKGRFGDWRVRGSYDWLDAVNHDSGKLLPLRARNTGTLGVSHIWGAFEAGVDVVMVGSRYNDVQQTARLGGYTLVNLTARYQVSKALSIQAGIDNVFDRQYTQVLGYNAPGVTAFVGIRYAM